MEPQKMFMISQLNRALVLDDWSSSYEDSNSEDEKVTAPLFSAVSVHILRYWLLQFFATGGSKLKPPKYLGSCPQKHMFLL